MSIHHLLTHLQANWDKYGVVILLIREIKIIEGIISVVKPIYNFLYNAMNVDETATWVWGKITGLFKKH